MSGAALGAALVLRAAGSHLYPGARGGLEGPLPGGPAQCLVEFADGSAALATVTPEGDGLLLATRPYTTARGTRIAAKRWRVVAEAGAFRVVRRA